MLEGFAGRLGFGRRPALIVVDMNHGFTDKDSPLGCDLDGVVTAIAELLDAARSEDVPISFTTLAYEEADKVAAANFIQKIPALQVLEPGSRWVAIDSRIAPLMQEKVIVKLFASAFFGTSLASWLTRLRVDTLLVTGASTSGCVRATVVDAIQYGLRPVVIREGVGDRNADAHVASLLDIEAKYGDVVPLEQAIRYLRSLKATGVDRGSAVTGGIPD
jgi:maleamate amidohydrolase